MQSSSESSENILRLRSARASDDDSDTRRSTRGLRNNNNSLSIANIEAISQRLGMEAAQRFRSMIESRRRQANLRVTSVVDITWLRDYLSDTDLSYVEDESAAYVKSIVSWYGPLAASLVLRMNKSNVSLLKCDYK